MPLINTTTRKTFIGKPKETEISKYRYQINNIPRLWLFPLCDTQDIKYFGKNDGQIRDELQKRQIDSVTVDVSKLRM